ncbi:MAG: class I SAM-dependent methyltransferase, partial [Lachnospiraceae bacterium]|nr:class I SAM-dependent methyltransferase [Lachnospiraceae bacterium]
ICAGMGGGLMMRILSEDQDKTTSFRELILQPQSEIERFRAGLREMGYQIADEQMIEEDGKFYPMMRVDMELCKLKEVNNIAGDNELCKLEDRYGGLLLKRKDRTLAAYLRREDRIYGEILTKLQTEGLSDVKRERRYTEVSKLRDECRMAMQIVADRPQT